MDTFLIYFLNSDGPQKNSTVLCNIYSSTFNPTGFTSGVQKECSVKTMSYFALK